MHVSQAHDELSWVLWVLFPCRSCGPYLQYWEGGMSENQRLVSTWIIFHGDPLPPATTQICFGVLENLKLCDSLERWPCSPFAVFCLVQKRQTLHLPQNFVLHEIKYDLIYCTGSLSLFLSWDHWCLTPFSWLPSFPAAEVITNLPPPMALTWAVVKDLAWWSRRMEQPFCHFANLVLYLLAIFWLRLRPWLVNLITPRCHPRRPLPDAIQIFPGFWKYTATFERWGQCLGKLLLSGFALLLVCNIGYLKNHQPIFVHPISRNWHVFLLEKVTDVDLFSAKDYPQSPEVWPGRRRTHGGTPKKNVRTVLYTLGKLT